jgi:predicted phosphodiesterase
VRYLILSDLHANIDALEAVLEAAPPAEHDGVIVLGDLVGYGAEPNAVVDRVRALEPRAIIRGNHDKAACGIADGSNFNHIARLAAEWTAGQLTPGNRQYLRALPQGPVTIDELTEICHGAPFDEDHYIFDSEDATRALDVSTHALCLFGHTHLPVVFERDATTFIGYAPDPDADPRVALRTGAKYLVNVGSVGQPRDGDPRAAFGMLDVDEGSVIVRRVDYPVELAQRRILNAGLPASLANRLGIGR